MAIPTKVASSADKYVQHIKKIKESAKKKIVIDNNSTDSDKDKYMVEMDDFLEVESEDEYISDI
jgi:hypothetical protein